MKSESDKNRNEPFQDEKLVIRNRYAGAKHISPAIVEALSNGNPDAYKAVYLLYHTPLEKFLTALLGSQADAEEITQDILAEIWEKRTSLDPYKNFSGYIYTMARHAAFDFFRHRKVHLEYAGDYYHSASSEVSGEEIVIANESELLSEILIHRMPEKRRLIFELHRKDGLTYEEIASKLNISVKTVEYHMSRALRELREVLTLLAILMAVSS